jgi:DNA-binding CsgD family transcriptional regulator
VDRVDEAALIGRLLDAVRGGLSGTLVLRGQPGIGKTALLDWTVGQAGDMLVTRVVGVETEMDLGFAGLHQVLVPFLGGLSGLPEPQREALGAAFGLVAGPAPDRFLVGLAALTLLTEAAAERPVLCVVDDAQWLDLVSVEVLGFVARRLLADRVGMVFAVRDGERRTAALDGFSDLEVGALPDEAAAELLAASAGQPVEQRVSERIVAQTAGNPLALVEFGSELSAAEAAGIAPLAQPLRYSGRLEELYQARVRALPPDARLLVLLAAADQAGDPAVIWRAADVLGLDPELAALQAVDRLVSWEPSVRFRHPLMRSAAYYTATVAARRRAHEALAAAGRDPDRRAWHLAEAAPGPDEQVAAELEHSADRARAHGGWASRAVFMERAAELTPEPDGRARRLLEAAEARFEAGDASATRELLRRAAPQLGDLLARAKARRLDGLSRYAAGEFGAAVPVLLDAARMIEPQDATLARDTLLDAYVAEQFSGAYAADMVEALRVAQAMFGAGQPAAKPADLLLGGFAAMAEHRYAAGAPLLHAAIAPLSGGDPPPDDIVRRFLPMAMAASLLYDDTAWHELEHRWVPELRRRGALAILVAALATLSYNQLTEGRFADAEATLAEGRELSAATGFRAFLALFATAELSVLAWRGREADARALAGKLLGDFTAVGHGLGITRVRVALCVLEVGLGNYAEALRIVRAGGPGQGAVSLVELVEAGGRSGDRDAPAAALAAFEPLAEAAGTQRALGQLALCRALLADDADTEPGYQLAIEHLRQSRDVPLLARSHLLYGEWLRRQRRRRDAREQLRTAWETFTGLGMSAFADRAHAELRATGETAGKRSAATQDALTPQEAQIARLASEGASNQEIAARLFISASTVEYHLGKVFRKLGITSRGRLARALGERDSASRPQ